MFKTKKATSSSSLDPLLPISKSSQIYRAHENFHRLVQKVIYVNRIKNLPFNQLGGDQGISIHGLERHLAKFQSPSIITCVDYSASKQFHFPTMNPESFEIFLKGDHCQKPSWAKVRWLNINGISGKVISTLAKKYEMHPLSIESLFFHQQRRVKSEIYDNEMFLSLLALRINDGGRSLSSESLSSSNNMALSSPFPISKHFHEHVETGTFILRSKQCNFPHLQIQGTFRRNWDVEISLCNIFLRNDGTVISFCSNMEILNPLFDRIKTAKTGIRTNGADFLLNSIIDSLVDHFLLVVDKYGDTISSLEKTIIDTPEVGYTKDLHLFKSELALLRNSVFLPTQSLIQNLYNNNPDDFISKHTARYLSNVDDHCTSILERVDTLEELCTSLIDFIFNSLSYATNENMKVLAAVNMIFLPITFLAGVYGMNFENLPELHWRNSYYIFWALVIAITLFSIVYFKRKRFM